MATWRRHDGLGGVTGGYDSEAVGQARGATAAAGKATEWAKSAAKADVLAGTAARAIRLAS